MAARTIVFSGSDTSGPPDLLTRFCDEHAYHLEVVDGAADVHALLNRSFPSCLVLDSGDDPAPVLELCQQIKGDTFTAIVPVIVIIPVDGTELAADSLAAGADEVVSQAGSDREQGLRFESVVRRAQRDVAVHPTTRLPGTVQIELNIGERLVRVEDFAVCYADLDNFKEFNDRYGTIMATTSSSCCPAFSATWFGGWHQVASSGTSAAMTSSLSSM